MRTDLLTAVFQAFKFLGVRDDLAEGIRRMPSPRAALQEATRLRSLQREDWFDINVGIMASILEAKFAQHPNLRHMLINTGNSQLIEDSPVNALTFEPNDTELT